MSAANGLTKGRTAGEGRGVRARTGDHRFHCGEGWSMEGRKEGRKEGRREGRKEVGK